MIIISILWVTFLGFALLPSVWMLLKKADNKKEFFAGVAGFAVWVMSLCALIMQIKEYI